MITLITGQKDSGKTRFIESWYHKEPFGVGCISRKVFLNGIWIGYDLILLPGERAIPFIRLAALYDTLFDKKLIYHNRLVFSDAAFQKAIEWVKSSSVPKNEPLWLDEVGKQELWGDGFDPIIRQALNDGREMRMVFRQHLFDALVCNYNITNYRRINCE